MTVRGRGAREDGRRACPSTVLHTAPAIPGLGYRRAGADQGTRRWRLRNVRKNCMANVELNYGAPPCRVVTYACDPDDAVSHYEHVRNTSIARMIAALMGGHFAGAYQERGSSRTPLYFVPHRTLVGRALAQRLGIRTPDDLYGGVVPFAFQATKAITHRLVGPRAHRPPGCSARFADAISAA